MDPNYLRPDLLPSTVPTLALWALAGLAVVLWVFAHAAVKRRFQAPRVRLGILVPTGTVASWCLFQLLGRHFFLAGRWPFVPQAVDLLFTAFVSGLCIELVSWLYRREASRVPSARRRRWIVGLRMAAVFVALWILLQPVKVSDRERTIRRTVVVLLDDSASMTERLRSQVPDYALLQMVTSLEVLRDVVSDDAVRHRIDLMMLVAARQVMLRETENDPYLPWLCGAGERPLVLLMTPGFDFPVAARQKLFAAIAEVPFSHAGSTRIVELSAAYWRCRANASPLQ